MSFRQILASAALLCCCAAPAAAQSVKLEFHDGRVNLSAQNASVRAILNEWARLGGTKIVNAERVPGAAVTLELNGVPERQALDIVLRSASGYLAGPREAGTSGSSAYASILILPTSTAPRPVAASPTPGFNPGQPQVFNPGQAQPFIPGQQVVRGQPGPDDDTIVEPPDPDDPPANAPARVPRNFVPPNRPAGAIVRPFPAPDLENDVQPEPPAPPPPSSVPANPFGVQLGSSRPGVISPVPQPAQQRPSVDPEP
jgi:hypothetical protein